MKVVAEYDVKMVECVMPASLYRLPKAEKNLKIEGIRLKQDFGYVEMKMKLPKTKCVSVAGDAKDRSMISYGSYGHKPLSMQWYAKIDHDANIVFLRKIDCVHVFSPKYEDIEVDDANKCDGYQLRKAESREEHEHRRKNINFQLKKMNLEEFIELEYKLKDMDLKCKDDQVIGKPDKVRKTVGKLKKSIENSKVVNFSEMMLLYQDENAVKNALQTYTNFVHGRYVISNAFYEKRLHSIRNSILDLFNHNERILMKDIENFIDGEYFLLEELCRRDGKYYYLKGFDEGMNVLPEEIMGVRVMNAVRKLQPCVVEKVSEELLVDVDAVKMNLPEGVVVLANGMLAVCEGDTMRKRIVGMLISKDVWRKSDVIRIAQNEFSDASRFFEVLGEYCELKGGVWNIKQ
ncbi:hypothetical protein CWI42_012150 [Ordospora colligata]|uniref:Uncharacterized protein n=1 Tax=Ordospora colligata OC4 TaxID=1354746 RepID=A0A0B2UMN1_9MICR|nr:uncharacterized protein M896_012150 [Ordospora colligata OC4]KHN70559.1 hypothetical protein M896_012150 [Ordospora colligata OC4]TBU17309.1 hypothetical protein CWI41_012150 [Ordospora colligata]TBU17559.1 hypothetical protein CWI40_012150 [Ordospora colligata]TBU19739.1 hypothetical protein CWI42_012150 [Ordospora colligata]